jgi:tagatose 6-phosphate kinase
MILAVTPNPALDVTYEISRVRWREASNRVEAVARRAGGKGINVARVLHQLGEEVAVVAPLGGLPGEAVRADMAASALRDETITIAGETRLTVFVVEAKGAVTGLSEPGPKIAPSEWNALETRCRHLLAEASVMTLSGSLPPGAPPEGFRRLVELGHDAGVQAILDTRDLGLVRGVEGAPAVVKVNEEELEGYAPHTPLRDAATRMRERGAGAVVVSRGAAGLVALTGDGAYETRPPERLAGNPTGAGDAATAMLAAGLSHGRDWSELLADAGALSAAAVLHPLAGSFDPDAYRDIRARIRVSELA